MFNKGNSRGFIDSAPIGGQTVPTSVLGDRALWKNAQNIAKKKSASETMNSPTPKFNPFCTARVWWPWYVPSAIISLNHKLILITKHKRDKKNIFPADSKPCILSTPVVVKQNRIILVNIGQGEGLTKWKGWAWKLARIVLDTSLQPP